MPERSKPDALATAGVALIGVEYEALPLGKNKDGKRDCGTSLNDTGLVKLIGDPVTGTAPISGVTVAPGLETLIIGLVDIPTVWEAA